jgi:hypothetical protein
VLTEFTVATRISSIVLVGLGLAAAIPGLVSAPESVLLALWGAGLFALHSLLRSGVVVPATSHADAPAIGNALPALPARLGRPVAN